MSIASVTQPIKIGILFDLVHPPGGTPPWDSKRDFLDAMRLTFDEAYASHQIDRPVELVMREVEGLPRGSLKAVINALDELVDEGCIAISGPLITENAAAMVEYVNSKVKVPMITWAGTEDFLGHWTFALSNASMPDEPPIIANIMAQHGLRRPAVCVEQGLIGEQYMGYFRNGCANEGLVIVGQAQVAAVVGDLQGSAEALAVSLETLRERGADSLVYLGFGWSTFIINEALKLMSWNPPKYTVTSWEVGFLHEDSLRSYYGWIGLEQFDEENRVARGFLDRFEASYRRRPEYFAPCYGHDAARILCFALANAAPLSPKGMRNAIERLRLMPAACGAPGTRISFGQYTHRGWVGAGFLIAREFDPDNREKTIFRGRFSDRQRG